jgi:hypothetical protein
MLMKIRANNRTHRERPRWTLLLIAAGVVAFVVYVVYLVLALMRAAIRRLGTRTLSKDPLDPLNVLFARLDVLQRRIRDLEPRRTEDWLPAAMARARATLEAEEALAAHSNRVTP